MRPSLFSNFIELDTKKINDIKTDIQMVQTKILDKLKYQEEDKIIITYLFKQITNILEG